MFKDNIAHINIHTYINKTCANMHQRKQVQQKRLFRDYNINKRDVPSIGLVHQK